MLSHLARSLIVLFWLPLIAVSEFGVTYDFSGGRFGDCLLSYLHAKWIAHQKGIPLFYRPFTYSKHLKMDEMERALTDLRSEPRMRVYWDNGVVNPRITLPLLYIIPYFPEDTWEIKNTLRSGAIPWTYFETDWKNREFRQKVLEMVAPRKPLALLTPPAGFVKIALHVREGGGFDGNDRYEVWPLKFPRMEFYAACLDQALEECQRECPNRPIYCFLFTDAKEPEEIVRRLQAQSNHPLSKRAANYGKEIAGSEGLYFDWRRKGNSHSANVLEDFFSFFAFDILIRSQSNFSLIPSLLHDFSLVYFPKVGSSGIDHGVDIGVERNGPLSLVGID